MIDVFVSVGKTATQAQEQFVQGLLDLLRSNDLAPQAVGRTSFSSKQPLVHIRELMEKCWGTVIIAFERLHIERGIDRRGAPNSTQIVGQNLPTVWNQIEASMGYIHGHPLLVLVENGLRPEGLLESGYDWYVLNTDLDLKTIPEMEFQGIFTDWKRRVEEKARSPASPKRIEIDAEKMKLSELLGSLTVKQLWAIIFALVASYAAVATFAYRIGELKPDASPMNTPSTANQSLPGDASKAARP